MKKTQDCFKINTPIFVARFDTQPMTTTCIARTWYLERNVCSCSCYWLLQTKPFGLKWHCSLHWRHNDHGGVSNHQPHQCLLNRLLGRRSKKTSKLRVTGLCVGNSPATGEFPAQMASNAENVSIWWRHHAYFWPKFTLIFVAKLQPTLQYPGGAFFRSVNIFW